MVFLGLVGMIDPPRPEVKEALQVASGAGIRTVTDHGDHYRTAAAVGKELGLLAGGREILNRGGIGPAHGQETQSVSGTHHRLCPGHAPA